MYCRLFRYRATRYVLILLLLFFIIFSLFYLHHYQIEESALIRIPEQYDEELQHPYYPQPQQKQPYEMPQQLEYKCCTHLNNSLQTNIFFVKTHKTGGSTVQNLIFRFAERHSLNIMFPIYYSYYQPFTVKSLWSDTITPDNKYNVLAYHVRYTHRLKYYQYPGTKTVTILRHPATLFQSIYEYFQMYLTVGMTFEQFLKAPIKPNIVWSNDISLVYRGYNQQSFDLGFDVAQKNNKTAVNQFINEIDQEFDFVMIVEHMEASLVLLANFMGWPLEYMVHLKTNARPSDQNQYVLTERDKLTLLELNHVDALLYHHFLQKFHKCVQQYGEDKLNQQILQLREMNNKFKERCVASENNFGILGAVNYLPKNLTDWECVQATKLQMPYEEELKLKQKVKLAKLFLI